MNWLSNSLVSKALGSSNLSIEESRRVCWVKTQISVCQGWCFTTDLLQGCWAVRASIKRVTLARLELVIISCGTVCPCHIVFFGPQGRVRVAIRPDIYGPTVVVARRANGNFLQLSVSFLHLLVWWDLGGAERLPLTGICLLVWDILIVSTNVSVKARTLRVLLVRGIGWLEIGMSTGLSGTVIVLHVGVAHAVVELGLAWMWVVFHYMTHVLTISWKRLGFLLIEIE